MEMPASLEEPPPHPERHVAPRHAGGSLLDNPAALHDVNAQCISMLVRTAREARPGGVPLNSHLAALLLGLTPEARARAAKRAFLLTDVQFANLSWWRELRDHPLRPAPLPSWRGSFPKEAAMRLMRSTLVLTWSSLRAHPRQAPLLGVRRQVAELIAELSPTDIESIVQQRFRHIRPRWEDRPAVWQMLLRAAESEDFRRMRDFDLYGVQLLTGEL